MRQQPSCYNKALDLLSRRAHFRRELVSKLAQRGYGEAEITETLERLVTTGLLDEEATIRGFLAARLARGPIGRRRLLAELERRGVDSGQARQAVDEVCEDDDLELTRQAAARWRSRRPNGQAAALARHLERRGFSRRAIFSVLRESSSDAAAPDEDTADTP